jgi:SAM-dependent methyltransferase
MAWFGIRKGVYRYLPGLTLVAENVLQRSMERLSPTARIIDVGAGGRKAAAQALAVDRFVEENTDIIADAHELPFTNDSFDAAVSTGTLEHLENPIQAIKEIHRILRNGGLIHIEVPFLQPYHGDPKDFWRWTRQGIEFFCTNAGFEKLESGTHMGPASTLNWIWNEFLLTLLGRKATGTILSIFFRIIGWPFLSLDRHIKKAGRGDTAACGVYFVGRKI